MLLLLIWNRPYERKSGNVISIFIQVIRAFSVICILVFVEELGISQTTKTVTGVVLIAVQSALSGLLAILIAANAIITCVRENPHRRRRKDAEKMSQDMDDLTPLDARNSLLTGSKPSLPIVTYDVEQKLDYNKPYGANAYTATAYSANGPINSYSGASSLNTFKPSQSPFASRPHQRSGSEEELVSGAAPFANGMNSGYGGYRGAY